MNSLRYTSRVHRRRGLYTRSGRIFRFFFLSAFLHGPAVLLVFPAPPHSCHSTVLKRSPCFTLSRRRRDRATLRLRTTVAARRRRSEKSLKRFSLCSGRTNFTERESRKKRKSLSEREGGVSSFQVLEWRNGQSSKRSVLSKNKQNEKKNTKVFIQLCFYDCDYSYVWICRTFKYYKTKQFFFSTKNQKKIIQRYFSKIKKKKNSEQRDDYDSILRKKKCLFQSEKRRIILNKISERMKYSVLKKWRDKPLRILWCRRRFYSTDYARAIDDRHYKCEYKKKRKNNFNK